MEVIFLKKTHFKINLTKLMKMMIHKEMMIQKFTTAIINKIMMQMI